MKCTKVLLTTFVLMVCVLFAGCTSPTEATIKPFETTVPTPPPGNNLFINIHGSINTTIGGNPSIRTKCWHPGRETAS